MFRCVFTLYLDCSVSLHRQLDHEKDTDTFSRIEFLRHGVYVQGGFWSGRVAYPSEIGEFE